MKNNPVILLGSYQVNDIYRLIITHLIDMGYKVVDISYNHEPPPFKYRSLTTRLLVLFKRIIFRQKNAKQKLIQKEKDLYIESVNKQVSKKLDQYKSFDFSIILGGQIYHKNHLLEIKRKTKNLMVAYQSDGLTRFPKIFDCLDIFHKVYIFDPKDYKSYKNSITNLYPATNFYFDRITFNTGKSNIPYSFYFRGVHLDELSRAKSISVFAKYALQNNLNTDITIYHLNNRSFKKHNKLYPSNVKASLQAIPFSENIENEKKQLVPSRFLHSHSYRSFFPNY
ncbi:hypothetical protein [Eikenella sp. Marseille-P7795]|uniref:hypothetical protein n=1 Tax=Eikenella sp. Marseille-P7795 TaxID=2866577 RepID=UPI001CE48C24|nr:hypothetical protein [Eikenella sp. Marseille-P7795]